MAGKTTALRQLLAEEEGLLHLPVAYDALGGRLIGASGFIESFEPVLSRYDAGRHVAGRRKSW
jgi:hypothetical protein